MFHHQQNTSVRSEKSRGWSGRVEWGGRGERDGVWGCAGGPGATEREGGVEGAVANVVEGGSRQRPRRRPRVVEGG
jgi:hypothetical protein